MLIPLSALLFKTFTLTWPQFWEAATGPRVLASYRRTFGASFIAALANVVFGLLVEPRSERPSDAQIRQKVTNLHKLVQLDWLAECHPSQLSSGGLRQRIVLARALAVEPQELLQDEPFGALEAKVRKELRRWLRCLHDELHVNSIFVTHDARLELQPVERNQSPGTTH